MAGLTLDPEVPDAVPRFTDGAVAVGLLKFCPAETVPRLTAVALPLLIEPLTGVPVPTDTGLDCVAVLTDAVPEVLLGADTLLAVVLFADVPLTRVATDFPDTDWRDAELEAALPTELLLPMPPRVETLLVKTLSEPVLCLEPCQRSSLSPPT